MQIREQGKQVQLIRSPYDKEKKRCVQKVAHTFQQHHVYSSDNINDYLSVEQVNDLSDDEKKTLSDWLRAKADKSAADGRRNKIIYADNYLTLLADAISTDGINSEKAAKIFEAMAAVTKALKKQGHKAGARAAVSPVAAPVLPGQEALFQG